MSSFGKKVAVIGFFIIIGGSVGALIFHGSPEPKSRYLSIKARQFAYEPPVIRVNYGDTLHINLASKDVLHGFFLEGYDIDAHIFPHKKYFSVRHPSGRCQHTIPHTISSEKWTEMNELVLIADKKGKFRYRCSQTCGTMHPFMQGELIVEPNSPYYAGIGAMIGLFFGMLFHFSRRKDNDQTGDEV